MSRKTKKKVGDRIFWENYDGTIGTALVKDIRIETSSYDMCGNPLPSGKQFTYNVYMTSEYTAIEDYNCLSDSDPRVKEYCKGKKFITSDFEKELREFLDSKGCRIGDSDVSTILYDLSLEYGKEV
jgi:hypothetical protein